jgi:hypothetical protein
MKVAVCFSGLPRGNVKKNISLFREVFAHDFFFSTWSGLHIENENFSQYEEPKHEYLLPQYQNLTKEKKMLMSRGCKQIVAHSLQLLFDIPDEYDMIIRCRYDVILNTKFDWNSYVNEAYEKNEVMGFRFCIDDTDWHNVYECHPKHLVLDQMIMHRRSEFDPTRSLSLFKNKTLEPCEMGWYQIFQNNTIRNFIGGLHIDRSYK